jgi:Rps23 Pro-64 3,4-dihydroxylase Tpa1-like proline 4-hydroxylase
MSPTPRRVARRLVSNRELFICDDFADAGAIAHVANLVRTLDYRRAEKSRPDTEVSGDAAEITPALFQSEPFFARLQAFGEEMFPGEGFVLQRLYVNRGVYGDMYYPHRDCAADLANITVLYYANPVWHADWGGDTIFYDDAHDAQVAVSPRPGRVIASRGAIIHRGGVPARACQEARFTIACKLAVSWI